MTTIDLSADVGESSAPAADAIERALIGEVTSVNIACGGHAGDDRTIADRIAIAASHALAIGAHPSYPDRAGFGRRAIKMDAASLLGSLLRQLRAVGDACDRVGERMVHVKPHGALYHAASDDHVVADVLIEAIRAVDPSLALFAASGSRAAARWRDAGMTVIEEGFADRGYLATGGLVPRGHSGAVIADLDAIEARATDITLAGHVTAFDGERLPLRCQTLCFHSDTPSSPHAAKRVRAALEGVGVRVARWDDSA